MKGPNLILKGIRVDELSLKMNNMRLEPDTKIEMKPSITRHVRGINENEKACLITLSVKIESTPEEPKPFEVVVTITGLFESDASTDAAKRETVIEGTTVLFPYLRATLTSLTTTAMTPPIILPLPEGAIFPEDNENFEILS